MQQHYAKTPIAGIVRDISTNAIINTNTTDYEKILQQRAQTKQAQTIQSQIDDLKSEFLELKEMLKQVLNGRV